MSLKYICLSVFAASMLTIPRPGFAKDRLVSPQPSSPQGTENIIVFDHIFESDFTDLKQISDLSNEERNSYVADTIEPLMRFLIGPGSYRSVGSPRGNDSIHVYWEKAYFDGKQIALPFHYIGTWILAMGIADRGHISLPVPRSYRSLFTKNWKHCTDSAPEHATESLFWYFWDPSRPDCDHVAGVQYENVDMKIGVVTNIVP